MQKIKKYQILHKKLIIVLITFMLQIFFLNKIKKYLIITIVNLYEFPSLKPLYTVIYSNNYINILHK